MKTLRFLLLGLGVLALSQSSCVLGHPRGTLPTVKDRFAAPTSVVRVAWSKPLVRVIPLLSYKPQEFAAAALGSTDQIFIGSSAKKFYSLRKRDGVELWSHDLTGGVSSEPLYLPQGVISQEAAVVVGDDDGALTALSAESGKVLWVYRVRGAIRVRPTYADGLIYFTSGEGKLYAVDARAGSWRWQYEREVPESFTIRGASGALAAKGKVFAGFPDGYVAALNAASGEALWTRQVSGDASRFTDVDGTPSILGDTLFTSSYTGGVFALDEKDGSTRWRYEMDGAGPLAVDAKARQIYVSGTQGGLTCLDLAGRLLWRQALSQQGELSPVTPWGRYLALSAASGGTFIVDAASGRLLQFFDPGHGVTGRVVARGGQAYLLSNAGIFFALTTG